MPDLHLQLHQKGGFIENIGIKEGMTSLGENKNQFLYVDKYLFKKELSSLIKKQDHLDQIIFFRLIHLAYEKSVNNNQNKKYYFIIFITHQIMRYLILLTMP